MMIAAPLPVDEAARIATLRRLAILDTPPEQPYDDLTALAAEVVGTPMALISFIDETRQWFKARVGLDTSEMPRSISFCAHAIAEPVDVFVVEDARRDARFKDNPLVTGDPRIRFYAGSPIVTADGHALGTIFVASPRPHRLSEAQRRSLAALARQAATLVALREQSVTSGHETRDRAPVPVAAQLKRTRGAELLDLVLHGDRIGLWDLHVPSGAWTVDARALAMLGYDDAHEPPALGTLQEMIHPDDWPSVGDAMQSHRDGQAAFFECAHRLRHRDGRWLWVLGRGVIVERDSSGTPVRIVGTHTDVTEARRLDDERRRNAERLELALSGGDMGMWDWDVPSGRLIRSAQWARLFGYTLEDTIGGDGLWERLVHPEDLVRSEAIMAAHFRDEIPMFEAEVRMRHRDGHWMWVMDRAKVVERDESGRAVRVVGTTFDITPRKRNELALASMSEMLARTGALARVGGWEIDADSRRVTWSDEVYRIPGTDHRGEVDSEGTLDDYTPASRLLLDAAIDAAISDGTPYDLELELVTAKGEPIRVRAIGLAERVDGRTVRVFGAIQDVTERKRVEDALIASERRIRTIADNLPAMVAHVDRDERYTFVNAALVRSLGMQHRDVLGRTIEEVCGTEMYRVVRPLVAQAMAGGVVSFESQADRDGKAFHFQSHYVPDVGPDGTVNGLYTMTLDITARKLAEIERAEADERLRGLTDQLPALIVELDPARSVRFCNGTYREWLGIDCAWARGRPYAEVVGPETYAACASHLEQALRGQRATFEQTLALSAGSRNLQTTFLPHFDADGSVAGVYGMTSDITELKVIEQRLDALARIDPLTGVANRRQFEERVVDAMARTRRSGVAMAVLYLDIDRFKAVNDSFGHAGGDDVLKEFADRLRSAVRETDVVARLAGDEFVVILENVHNDAEAHDTARKVVDAMRAPFRVQGVPHVVTTSAGVATFAGGELSVAALLSTADAALYAAKSGGRDRVHVAILAPVAR